MTCNLAPCRFHRMLFWAIVVGLSIATITPPSDAAEEKPAARDDAWTFVSWPDFTNIDVAYPQPNWDDALDFMLDGLAAERPDFALVAGDLLMGRWWEGQEQIQRLSAIYYPAWIRRMQEHGLKFYVAVGDHELGDGPWWLRERQTRLAHIPFYEKAFVDYMKMPQNGPDAMRGLAYSLVHKNCLFVVVNPYEFKKFRDDGYALATVSGQQLAWVDRTLSQRAKEVDHLIVMGHTPIVAPVRARASSQMTLDGGRQSPLWQVMKKHGVDLYLCGEVHDITCTEVDGVMQIAHGGLIGYVDTVNYLVATVTPQRISLELKELPIVLEGDYLPQSAGNQPREFVKISPEASRAGFQSVGTAVLDKPGGQKRFRDKLGRFDDDYYVTGPSPATTAAARAPPTVDSKAIAARLAQIAQWAPENGRLAAYLNCGVDAESSGPGPVKIRRLAGSPFVYQAAQDRVPPTQATVYFHENEVTFEITGLQARSDYVAGFTWWDHNLSRRTQSVVARTPNGDQSQVLSPPVLLPNWPLDQKLPDDDVRRCRLDPALAVDGRLLVAVRKEGTVNAVICELWIWEVARE